MKVRAGALVCAVVCAAAVSAWAADASDPAARLAQANAKYQAGDFKAAAEFYEKALQARPASAACYYNLGNARFRLGQKGRALVNFERARRLSPRDPDILWNIQVTKSLLLDRLETPEGPGAVRRLTDWMSRFSLDEIGVFFSFLLLLFFVNAFFVFMIPLGRPLGQGIYRLTALVLSATFVLGWIYWFRIKDPTAVVLDKEAFVYYGPSKKETKAFLLHEGAQTQVRDQLRDWYYVQMPNGNVGWIPKESCEIV